MTNQTVWAGDEDRQVHVIKRFNATFADTLCGRTRWPILFHTREQWDDQIPSEWVKCVKCLNLNSGSGQNG